MESHIVIDSTKLELLIMDIPEDKHTTRTMALLNMTKFAEDFVVNLSVSDMEDIMTRSRKQPDTKEETT